MDCPKHNIIQQIENLILLQCYKIIYINCKDFFKHKKDGNFFPCSKQCQPSWEATKIIIIQVLLINKMVNTLYQTFSDYSKGHYYKNY